MVKGLTSIIVPAWNEVDYTRQCIESILEFTDAPFELIVIDNGSSDGTSEFLSSVDKAIVIKNEENLGFPRACNQGIQRASGEYLVLLNSDVIVTKNWLSNLLNCAQSSPRIGLVGPVSNKVSGPQQISVSYSSIPEMHSFAAKFNQPDRSRWFELDRLVGFCLLIKRDVIERVGYLDERFGIGNYEDDDFCIRARMAGYRLVCAGDTFVHHFGSATFAGNKVNYAELLARNREIFREKWAADASRIATVKGETLGSGLEARGSRPTLSLCMIVRNEEENLSRCLNSVKGVVDEIIVVDTGSTDKTVEIARDFGAKVYGFPWKNDFSKARNVSLEHATGDWILFLDADEELVEEDRFGVFDLIEDDRYDGFYVNLINFVGDQPGIEAVINPAFRLFRNKPDYRFSGAIHEQILPSIQAKGGKVDFSKVRVNHYGYLNQPVVEKNKISRNLRILLKEVRKEPANNFTRFNIGVEYMRSRRYEDALHHFRMAFKKLPSLNIAYGSVLVRNIVLCLKELKRYEEALNVLLDALEAYPDYTDLMFLKGLIYLDMKQYDKALNAFQECISMGESHWWHITQAGVGGYKAWIGLGDAYYALGNNVDAIRAYTRALKLNSKFPVPIYRLAAVLIPGENTESVKAFFEKFLDTTSRDVLFWLAQAFFNEKQYAVALEYVERAMALACPTPQFYLTKGECLLNLKRYSEAVEVLDLVGEDTKYYYPAVLDKGFCFAAMGEYKSAVSAFDSVAQSELYRVHGLVYRRFTELCQKKGLKQNLALYTIKSEAEPLVWDVLGKLLELQEFEMFESALPLLDEVGCEDKELKLGKLYHRYGFDDSAAEELIESVRKGTYDAEALVILGHICREKGLLDDAEVFYSQAIELDGTSISTYTALASILSQRRRYKDAQEVLCKALVRFPGSELLLAAKETLESIVVLEANQLSHVSL